jgi:hypothetical protein
MISDIKEIVTAPNKPPPSPRKVTSADKKASASAGSFITPSGGIFPLLRSPPDVVKAAAQGGSAASVKVKASGKENKERPGGFGFLSPVGVKSNKPSVTAPTAAPGNHDEDEDEDDAEEEEAEVEVDDEVPVASVQGKGSKRVTPGSPIFESAHEMMLVIEQPKKHTMPSNKPK